ncbi:MAG: hypothetical protein HQ536_00260 [Parcubacteria group bacterium]|nr:hypothetical protein [Parcubacteria group bacterium]
MPKSLTYEIKEYLEENLPKYDVVVVLDYAHGFLNNELINTICEKSKFLAVNTQTNAANFGFNVITKYPRADYVCIDWQEAKLAVQQKHLPVKDLIKKIAEKVEAKKIVVTTGHEGSVSYDCQSDEYNTTPVLSWKVVDRMGAGDAFLSITAPCVAAGLPMNLVGFIGNAVGAAAVGIVGNKTSVEPDSLNRFINTLLK